MSDAKPIRLLIVDDQAVVRSGLRMLLGTFPDLQVLGEAEEGGRAVDQVATLLPDVVLMDVRMPGVNGIEATRRIGALSLPRTVAVLVLTTFAHEDHLFDALRAGAAGFALKDAAPEELASAIRAVARGDSYIAPGMTRHLIDAIARNERDRGDASVLDALTAREREVLVLVGRGMGNAQIARTLVVEETTVKTHVRHLLRKLGLTSRVQAAVLATRFADSLAGDTPPG